MTRIEAWMVACVALALTSTSCAAGEGEGESGSRDGATFTTSLAGDKPLTSLNGSELDTLCADQAMFLSGDAFRTDACRLSAILSVAFSSLDGEITDANLQRACASAYSECLNRAAGAPACDEPPPPASCTATVADVSACLNEGAMQAHLFAMEVPDCDSLSVADIIGMSSDLPAGVTGEAESCRRLKTSCPSISEDARAFSDEYCDLIAPCCTAAGLGSQCQANVYQVAEEGTFDASAAAACLGALRERQGSADFCDGLVPEPWATWQVVPECGAVFGEDPSGPRSVSPPAGAPGTPGAFTAQATAELGHACLGTRFSFPDGGVGEGTFGPVTADSYVCDHDQGVYCDSETRVCAAGRALGEACLGSEECAVATGFCSPLTGTCMARVQPGGACTGIYDECEAPGMCDSTGKCTVPPAAGEACSNDPGVPSCASGQCVDGVCENALAPLCGR